MPKKARELTALELKRLTRPGLHFVGEIPGLALQVLPTGGRTWVLRMMVGAKRRDMGLGGYPEVSLADARAKARVARDRVRAGIDPIAEAQATRSALRAAQAAAMTFQRAAGLFIDTNRSGWSNAKHAAQWASSLARYVYPIIGQLNVQDIGRAHVLTVLEQHVGKEGKFWECRTETAERVRGRIERVLDWAKGRGHRTGDNPATWKGNLDAVLPKAKRIKNVEHHPAVSLDDMPGFFSNLRKREGTAARALEFVILTAARSGEVRGMTWSEVDMNSGSWVVPAGRMKAGKEHRVPLSSLAVSLLERIPRHEGTDLVFPSPRGGLMSDMSLTSVMRRMDREEVPHGFRSSFRDWAAELTHYPREMAEMALAHSLGNAVEAAYRRGDMFEKRREMMEDWADFVSGTAASTASFGSPITAPVLWRAA